MPENEALVSSALYSKRPLLSEIEVKHTCDSIASVVVEEGKSILKQLRGRRFGAFVQSIMPETL